jgi:hypothetical protein
LQRKQRFRARSARPSPGRRCLSTRST